MQCQFCPGVHAQDSAVAQAGILDGLPAKPSNRVPKLESVLQHNHIFGHTGARYSVQIIEKDGLIQISGYPANTKARIKDAILAARALINYSPTQFTIVVTRYIDARSPNYFTAVIVTARDITSLSVGTSTMDDLIKSANVVDVGPQDNQTSILNKYLTIAEKQMVDGNYWEAEQIVDAALRAVGNAPNEQSRLTQDMLTLAEGLDARGDLERAEHVLKKVLEVRTQNGRLDDPDAERTIDHLTDLYIGDKKYSEAQELLNRLISDPSLNESTNPTAYANNLERLGICHFKASNFDQALTEFTKVVALKRQQAGEDSPALAMALEELGDTYKAQGQTGTAQTYFKQAHAIYDHAVVSRNRKEKMDFPIYDAHVRKLDAKLK